MTLWPHAWPMPGRASYSHMIAMVGPSPVSIVATNAVSMPATPPCSTFSPFADRNSVSQPAA